MAEWLRLRPTGSVPQAGFFWCDVARERAPITMSSCGRYRWRCNGWPRGGAAVGPRGLPGRGVRMKLGYPSLCTRGSDNAGFICRLCCSRKVLPAPPPARPPRPAAAPCSGRPIWRAVGLSLPRYSGLVGWRVGGGERRERWSAVDGEEPGGWMRWAACWLVGWTVVRSVACFCRMDGWMDGWMDG